MLYEFCKEKKGALPENVSTLNRRLLIEVVRNLLHNKRYVVLFDDVWNEKFWDDIESALIDDKNESRILITTRYERGLQTSAFEYGSNGRCPEELKDISLEIVRKCKGLPLAIVASGGLLSQKHKSAPVWVLFSQNLSLELERNSELNSIAKILSVSYNDLPYNPRSCLLYFGMYPEDYEVKSGRLISQWIAEGFVEHESGKTLEEVAQQHLIGLITRNLVQVSSFTVDDKVKECRVHDLIHEMIHEKIKATGFCQHIDEQDDDDVIDLHFMSSLSTLRKLFLHGKLQELPNWIPGLQNLVKLSLKSSKLTNDPLESLKDMPNLLFLSIDSYAYEGKMFIWFFIYWDESVMNFGKMKILGCFYEIAVVALPGGIGTLDKMFEILALIQLEWIGSELPFPFLLMTYDSFYSKLLDFLMIVRVGELSLKERLHHCGRFVI
ncbi:Disease resistance protein RPM1 [Spatholobus suberectus]|nr:Disease resistance protein RPM1 [Spatholobus suberectus]